MKEDQVSDSVFEAIIAYFDNKINQPQAEELISWLEEKEDNISYFNETGRIFYASGLVKKCMKDPQEGWDNLLTRIRESGDRPVPGKRISIPLRSLYLSAAAIALLIAISAVGILFLDKPAIGKTEGYYETEAPKGSRSAVTLSDGSRVWLNSGTKLHYKPDFGVKSRDLILDGEAYFIVAENRKIPFRVRAGEINITARGTAFNVKAYKEENVVETTLEKGEVIVERVNDVENTPGASFIVLKPNQKAVFIKKTRNLKVDEVTPRQEIPAPIPEAKGKTYIIKVDTLVDTKLSTSWKDSKWIFRSKMLHDLAPILERRYDIKIIFRDSVLKDYKFTGTLKEESLEQVLKAMTFAAPMTYEVSHNTVYLYSDPSHRYKLFRHIN